VSVSREVELKLELPIAATARLLERSFNRLEGNQGMKQHLVSVYFDTAKHALREHGLTLRIRSGGKRRVRTIKAADTASASSSLRLACCRGAPSLLWAASSSDNCLLPEEGFGFYTPAIDAVELVHSKVAASWIVARLQRALLACGTSAGVIHKKIKRQGESPLALGDGATE
jgi:CYTH domain